MTTNSNPLILKVQSYSVNVYVPTPGFVTERTVLATSRRDAFSKAAAKVREEYAVPANIELTSAGIALVAPGNFPSVQAHKAMLARMRKVGASK